MMTVKSRLIYIERRDKAHKHDDTWWFDDTPEYIETYDDALKYVDDMMEITSNPFEYRVVVRFINAEATL